eukprot:scaffold27124_cov39-Isochrysis_galbana.AAC.1
MDAGALPGQTFVPPPSIHAGASLTSAAVAENRPAAAPSSSSSAVEHMKVMQLVMAYQVRPLPSRYSGAPDRTTPPY